MNKEVTQTDLDFLLVNLYGEVNLNYQKNRYSNLAESFKEKFNTQPEKYFSAPGRTEISGNHTDHNHGKVIAASINLDSIAAASPYEVNEVNLYSEGFKELFKVNIEETSPVSLEVGTTKSLIRGIAAGFKERGYLTGGFNACITSDVLIGSGLSSSASVEVLIGTIFNHFYNEGNIPNEVIAMIGQYAENNFFGKPCGLMDQMACAVGGIIEIDFYNPDKPLIKKSKFDIDTTGYRLIVVDTGGSHIDLTNDYASIPKEMKLVANYFNKKFCSEISLNELLPEIKSLRKKIGDRAIIRSIHFLEENERVEKQIKALAENNFTEFLKLVNESGDSSFKYLQNIFSPTKTDEQGVSLALSLTDIFIKEKGKGACRIHGGGFAGTILVFLPDDLIKEYKSYISQVFTEDAVKILTIRKTGAVCLNNIS